MFEDMVVSSSNPTKTNKPWTVVLSMLAQVLFLGVLILIPLIYTEALPKTMMATLLVAPPPPPPPPPPPGRAGRPGQAASPLDGRRQTRGSRKSSRKTSRLLRKKPLPI